MSQDRLTILFEKHVAVQLNADERLELMGLFLEPALQPHLQQLVDLAWDKTGEEEGLPEEKKQMLFQQIFNKIDNIPAYYAKETPVIEMASARGKRTGWKRWVIAASFLVLGGVGSYFFFLNNRSSKSDTTVSLKRTDIEAPQKTKAIITLADGRNISLDSFSSIRQGEVQLTKTADGKIIYSGNSNVVAFNTITNPRGSKIIDVILSDGSQVWLNAGSSVTYPVAFTGSERKISVNGEAYFEIAHDAFKPFIVSKGAMQVSVLGTSFNVNAYEDEAAIRVTLLDGSVRVNITNKLQSIVLKPGQQAIVHKNNAMSEESTVDVDAVMAWKNGLFNFSNADLPTVLRELSRWYDVNFVYDGTIPNRLFEGKLQRELKLSEVLTILEKNNVNFSIQERTIVVRP